MEEDLNSNFIVKKPTAALILENGQTPADDLLKKFNGVWDKDIYKIFTISN